MHVATTLPRPRQTMHRLGDNGGETQEAISAASNVTTVIGATATIGSLAGATAAGTAAALGLGPAFAAGLAGVAAAAPYVAAVLAVAMVVLGFFDSGPSKAWLSFGTRLKETLDFENDTLHTLAVAIVNAQSESEMLAAVDRYYETMTSRIPTFGQGPEDWNRRLHPWNVLTPPGATGEAHEGKLTVNFGPVTAKIEELIQKKRDAFAAAAASQAGMISPPTSPGQPYFPESSAAPPVSSSPLGDRSSSPIAPLLLIGGGLFAVLLFVRR